MIGERMVRFLVLLISAPMWLATPEPAFPQAAAAATLPTPQAVAIPDSVRKKVGDYRIEGLVIGGALGALAGVGLAGAQDDSCVDCANPDPNVLLGGIIGGGLGGVLGFVIGVSSPKYRWERAQGP
jgi:hypothetical protein